MALIRTLALAGIKRNKAGFVGLFLLMVLTAAALCFNIGMYADLNDREQAALAETGAGDVFAYDFSAALDDEVVAQIEAIDEVAAVHANEAVLGSAKAITASGEDKLSATATYLIEAWGSGIRYQAFNDEGTAFVEGSPGPAPGEVFVPIAFQVTPGVKIGDRIELGQGDGRRSYTITGYIEDPQLGTPFMEVSHVAVSEEDYTELAEASAASEGPSISDASVFNVGRTPVTIAELNIDMTDAARAAGVSPNDLTKIIFESTDWGKTTSGLFSSTTLAGYAMIVVIIGTAILAVFALLVFVISLVICTHNIASSIEMDFADYGTLKALGVTQKSLARVLVAEYAGTSLAGLFIGFLIAQALIPPALPFFALLTGILAGNGAVPTLQIVFLVALLALVVGVVLYKARKLGRITPFAAFRSGTGDVVFKSPAERPISGRMLTLQLALRSILSAKRRYVGLFACACILCAFVVLVFGIGSKLHDPDSSYDAFSMWKADMSVSAVGAGVDFDEVARTIEEVTPIESSWQETFGMINLKGESRSFVGLSNMGVITGVSDGRAPLYDNEVLIGAVLARSMDLQIGDEMAIPLPDGSTKAYIVSGFLSSMFNAGYGSIVTYDSYAKHMVADPSSLSDAWNYRLADASKADEAKNLVAQRFGDAVNTEDGGLFKDTTSIVNLVQQLFVTMGYAMAAIALLLVFLAVSMIAGKMFVTERQDLGVFKALGFTATRLRWQFALRFCVVALIGCLVGAALTSLGGSWLMGQLFGMFGATTFTIDTSPLIVFGTACGMAALFLFAAFFAARAIKRIEPRELVVE